VLQSLPQIQHLPTQGKVSHDAALASIELADSIGLILDEAQRHTIMCWMAETANDKFAAFECAHIMARQNGKGVELTVRQLGGLFVLGEQLQLHTAHEFRTCNEHFLRVAALVESSPALKRRVARIRYANGEQGIELKSGARLKFLARSGGAGRGFAGASTVYYDEAMYLQSEHVGASLPTLSTHPNPQVVYTGSAGFGTSSQMWHLRRRALSGDGGRLAYLEHTAEEIAVDGDRLVSNRDIVDLSDQTLWYAANPALGNRITSDFVEAEYRSMARDEFARERLGIWEPEPLIARERVFSIAQWSANYVDVEPDLPIGFAVDVAPDRRTAAIAAVSTIDAKRYVTILEHRPNAGLGWVVERITAIAAQYPDLPWCIDPGAAAGALVADLNANDINVTTVSARDVAQACGAFHDAVVDNHISYRRQRALDDAVTAATVRPLGDAWAWDRRSSDGDISPLVAVTLALHVARNLAAQRRPQVVDVWR